MTKWMTSYNQDMTLPTIAETYGIDLLFKHKGVLISKRFDLGIAQNNLLKVLQSFLNFTPRRMDR